MTEQRRALAQTKVSRQQQIVTILTRQEVGSQSQLAQLLAAEGIDVTQATLSRDLVELQAEKVRGTGGGLVYWLPPEGGSPRPRSEEHTSELQSRGHLVCRLLLEKKKKATTADRIEITHTRNSEQRLKN